MEPEQQSKKKTFYSSLTNVTRIARDIKTDMLTEDEFCRELEILCATAPGVATAIATLISKNLNAAVDTGPYENNSREISLQYCRPCSVEKEISMLRKRLCIYGLRNESNEELLVDIKLSNKFLSQSLAAMREEYDEMEEQLTAYESSLSEITNGQDDHAAKVVYRQEMEILRLRRLLEKAKEAASFTRLHEYIPRNCDIISAMNSIGKQINRILPFVGDTQGAVPDYEVLKPLLQRNNSEEILPQLVSLGLRDLISTITAVVLCNWVFRDDYETRTTSCLLLDMYRKKLRLVDGENLWKLDLAAHDSLFSDACYHKDIVAPRSQKLGLRLLKIIDHFIPPTCDHVPDSDALRDLFTQAIQLKCVLLVSTYRHVIVLFSPGAKYDEGVMEPQIHLGERDVIPQDNYLTIKACILPAIFLESTPSYCVVSYRLNVVTTTDALNGYRLISKGVVII